MPEVPRDLPWAEYVRLIELGKKAMAVGEYGRAAEHFGRAVALLPKEPEAYFALMQSQIALGKYFEALDNLRAGLTRKPNWPAQPTAPRELYGAGAIEYPDHLARLGETAKRLAGEMGLQFLYATQLWVDGKADDARKLLEPLRMGPDREFVEMFLGIKPAGAL
jgi:tetratricopeptide (TPR) repeat protein